MQSTRPLLFLDVDGVINDLEAVVGMGLADAAQRSDLVARLDVEVFDVEGFVVAVPRYMPELIGELARRAEIWWCTTWRGHANGKLAEYLGVGPFPVLDPDGDDHSMAWKAESVRPHAEEAVAAGRTVIWIEDFNGECPPLHGVHYVDTGARGVLRRSDLPVHLLE